MAINTTRTALQGLPLQIARRPIIDEKPYRRPKEMQAWYDAQDMTLCIGALTQTVAPEKFAECIVLCFDSKVSASDDAFASETEYKLRVLSDDVVALISGRPGRAKELCTLYRNHLRNVVLTDENVLDRLREPLKLLKHKLAEAYTQRKLAISYQDLIDRDENWIGKERRDKYLADIENNSLGVHLIFAGFIGHNAFLYELCEEEIECRTNFAIIGNGFETAAPALHFRKQTATTPLEDTVYHVYESKRAAEISPSVGKETIMYVLYPPSRDAGHTEFKRLSESGEKYLKGLYRRYGPRPFNKWRPLPAGTLQTAVLNVDKSS